MGNWDLDTLEQAEAEAIKKTVETGIKHIATDAGPYRMPRYDVLEVPKVGDEVSYSFNGDSTPCGVITKISKTLKVITTSEGGKFYRLRQTGSWLRGGTWSLIPGHTYSRNPSF